MTMNSYSIGPTHVLLLVDDNFGNFCLSSMCFLLRNLVSIWFSSNSPFLGNAGVLLDVIVWMRREVASSRMSCVCRHINFTHKTICHSPYLN